DAGVFTLLDSALTSVRTGHAAALLYDGTVLITGGYDGAKALASVDMFDPYSNVAFEIGALATARAGHSATTLLDGKVAVIGGASNSGELASIEVYDPA